MMSPCPGSEGTGPTTEPVSWLMALPLFPATSHHVTPHCTTVIRISQHSTRPQEGSCHFSHLFLCPWLILQGTPILIQKNQDVSSQFDLPRFLLNFNLLFYIMGSRRNFGKCFPSYLRAIVFYNFT